MRKLYTKVYDILNTIDFTCIWPDFSIFPFALYNQDKVYLRDETIPYDRRFLGNTSMEYNEDYLAIWRVEAPGSEDPEVLAADLVHEMFHAFQQKNREARFPNDLLLLDDPGSKEYYRSKHSENLLLAKALATQDTAEKRSLINTFMSARKYREGLAGELIKQEYRAETIEGMAEYAGCMALKQISMDKYRKRIATYIDALQASDSRFFDIRRMSYFTGSMLCLLLSESNIDFFHAIGAEKRPLFDIVSEGAAARKPGITFDAAVLSQLAIQHKSEKVQAFKDFLSSHTEEVTIDTSICGYDPMNMIKLGDLILCTHFIMLASKDSSEPVFIQGPVAVKLKSGSLYGIQSYRK